MLIFSPRCLPHKPSASPCASPCRRAIEGLAGRIGALEERTSQASYFLPPFEQRSCAGYIQGLRQDLEACKSKVRPPR